MSAEREPAVEARIVPVAQPRQRVLGSRDLVGERVRGDGASVVDDSLQRDRIEVRLRHVEVDECEQVRDVGHRGRAVEPVDRRPDLRAELRRRAGEQLVHLRLLEVTQPARRHHLDRDVRVDDVLGRDVRDPPVALRRQHDGVRDDRRGVEDHGHAVREHELEWLEEDLRMRLAGGRGHLRDGGGRFHQIAVDDLADRTSADLPVGQRLQRRRDVDVGGQLRLLLLRAVDDHVRCRRLPPVVEPRVHEGRGDAVEDERRQVERALVGQDRRTAEVGLHVRVGVCGVLLRVPRVVGGLHPSSRLRHGTDELCLGEPEPVDPLELVGEREHRVGGLTLSRPYDDARRIERAHDVVAARIRIVERVRLRSARRRGGAARSSGSSARRRVPRVSLRGSAAPQVQAATARRSAR